MPWVSGNFAKLILMQIFCNLAILARVSIVRLSSSSVYSDQKILAENNFVASPIDESRQSFFQAANLDGDESQNILFSWRQFRRKLFFPPAAFQLRRFHCNNITFVSQTQI